MGIDIKTDKEKEIIGSIIDNPEKNEGDIAKILPYDTEEIRYIRRKWESEGLINKVLIPNFQAIGCELLTVFHGDFNVETPYEMRGDYLPSTRFDQIFYVAASDLQHVSMSAAPNFTETRRYIDYMEDVYGKQGFFGKGANKYIWFPLELTDIHKFFDYGPIVADRFNIERNCKTKKINTKRINLSENEKKVIRSMIMDSRGNDIKWSEETGLSRQTINKIKNKLIRSGTLIPRVSVDLLKLDYKFIAFRYSHFTPNIEKKYKESCNEYQKTDSQVYWLLTSGNFSTSLSAYRNYKDYEEGERQYRRLYKDMETDERRTRLFRLGDTSIRCHMYKKIVNYILGETWKN